MFLYVARTTLADRLILTGQSLWDSSEQVDEATSGRIGLEISTYMRIAMEYSTLSSLILRNYKPLIQALHVIYPVHVKSTRKTFSQTQRSQGVNGTAKTRTSHDPSSFVQKHFSTANASLSVM